MPTPTATQKPQITTEQRQEYKSAYLNAFNSRVLTQNGIAARGKFFETIINAKTTEELFDGLVENRQLYKPLGLSLTDIENFNRAFGAVTAKLGIGR